MRASANYVAIPGRGTIPRRAMEGWTKRVPAESPELRLSPRPVIAVWSDGAGDALILYEDGMVEFEGRGAPIELLPYVQAEWHLFLRGKIA